MRSPTSMYDAFARVLSYPDDRFGDALSELQALTADESLLLLPSISGHIHKFIDAVGSLPLEEMEDLYTRTFDITPLANLEIGWHLYGEQYERGAFLVKMRESLRASQIEESVELPDHLTHVLLAFGRMEKPEADVFAVNYVLPALEKILAGFKDQKNPYQDVLQSIKNTIEQYHVAGVTVHE